ncbi:MAG TPA: alpha/beta hydrolase [Acidimicrobiales bacterium]|nr:alpha/beta hydrolase [Acidimicrobiales bacterium]
MALDPVTAQINDLVQAVRKDAPPPTVAAMREAWAQLIAQVGTAEMQCKVESINVGDLTALTFTPPSCDDGLVVWFHGGGWVVGSPSTAVNEVDRLAVAARCRILSVDYRLAPEHPFPTSQLDGVASAAWCLEHAGDFDADQRCVAVGGDSAGGNLAAVAAQRVPGLCAQVLVYPGCDLSAERQSHFEHTEGYLLDGDSIDFFFQQVGTADRSDPLVSPMFADQATLAASPPALVITAEYDPLRVECAEYAAKLRDTGVNVDELHFDRQMHGFFSMPEVLEDARIAIERAASFLDDRFAAARGSTL